MFVCCRHLVSEWLAGTDGAGGVAGRYGRDERRHAQMLSYEPRQGPTRDRRGDVTYVRPASHRGCSGTMVARFRLCIAGSGCVLDGLVNGSAGPSDLVKYR